MSIDSETKWLENFTHRLSNFDSKQKRIRLATLWDIYAAVFAHRPDTAQRRAWLLKCLRHAEEKNVVKLPKRAWENFGAPPLPRYVERIVEIPAAKNRRWKNHYWHRRLEWVADLNFLSEEDERFLRKVDEGLKKNQFDRPAALNRRSVELTGNEKRLKDLLKKKLFVANRLDRELLNITSDALPLSYEIVGDRPVALVFENREPFNVAFSVLANLPAPPYGILAFGYGNGFADSIGDFVRIQNSPRYRAHIGAPLEQIHYVGDLDWAGLRIARRASLTAQRKFNLPPLVPATEIHRAMLDSLRDEYIALPDGFPPEKIPKLSLADPSLVEWLPTDVRDEALRILTLGNRIPEEMLTAEALSYIWNSAA